MPIPLAHGAEPWAARLPAPRLDLDGTTEIPSASTLFFLWPLQPSATASRPFHAPARWAMSRHPASQVNTDSRFRQSLIRNQDL
jgi:hypothetical protein